MGELVGLLFFVFLYFVPVIVAAIRKHSDLGKVFVINLFLGWTFIGWVWALVMSVSRGKEVSGTWPMLLLSISVIVLLSIIAMAIIPLIQPALVFVGVLAFFWMLVEQVF